MWLILLYILAVNDLTRALYISKDLKTTSLNSTAIEELDLKVENGKAKILPLSTEYVKEESKKIDNVSENKKNIEARNVNDFEIHTIPINEDNEGLKVSKLEEAIRARVREEAQVDKTIELSAINVLKDIPHPEVRKKLAQDILDPENVDANSENINTRDARSSITGNESVESLDVDINEANVASTVSYQELEAVVNEIYRLAKEEDFEIDKTSVLSNSDVLKSDLDDKNNNDLEYVKEMVKLFNLTLLDTESRAANEVLRDNVFDIYNESTPTTNKESIFQRIYKKFKGVLSFTNGRTENDSKFSKKNKKTQKFSEAIHSLKEKLSHLLMLEAGAISLLADKINEKEPSKKDEELYENEHNSEYQYNTESVQTTTISHFPYEYIEDSHKEIDKTHKNELFKPSDEVQEDFSVIHEKIKGIIAEESLNKSPKTDLNLVETLIASNVPKVKQFLNIFEKRENEEENEKGKLDKTKLESKFQAIKDKVAGVINLEAQWLALLSNFVHPRPHTEHQEETIIKIEHEKEKIPEKHEVNYTKDKSENNLDENLNKIHSTIEKIKENIEMEKQTLNEKIEHTQNEIKDKIEDNVSEIKDKLENIKHKIQVEKDKIHEKIEEHKNKVAHQKEVFKEKVEDKLHEIKDKLQDIKHKVETEKEKVHEKIEEHKHKVEHKKEDIKNKVDKIHENLEQINHKLESEKANLHQKIEHKKEKIKEKVEEKLHEIKDKLQHIKHKVEAEKEKIHEKIEEHKHKVEHQKEEFKEKVDEKFNEIKDKLQHIKHKVEAEKEKIHEKIEEHKHKVEHKKEDIKKKVGEKVDEIHENLEHIKHELESEKANLHQKIEHKKEEIKEKVEEKLHEIKDKLQQIKHKVEAEKVKIHEKIEEHKHKVEHKKEDIKKKVGEKVDEIHENLEHIKHKLESEKANLHQKIEHKKEAIKEKVEEKLHEIKDKLQHIKHKVEAEKEKIHEKIEEHKHKVEHQKEEFKEKVDEKFNEIKDKLQHIKHKVEAEKEKIHEKIEEHKHKVEHKKEDIKKKVGEKVDEIHEKLEHIKHELESEKANLHQKIEHKKEEIKEKVEEKLHEIKDKLQHIKHKVEAEKEKIHEKIEEHKHKVEHQKEEFKEKVDEKFNEIKDKLQHIKHKVEAEKEKIHEKIEEHKHKVEHKKEDIKKKVGEKVEEIHENLEHIKHKLESEKANLHQKIEHKKEEIKEKVEEKLHEIKDKLQHIKHKVEAEKEKIHEKIEEHKHKVEHQKEEFKEKVDEKFNEIKDKLQHIKHKVEAEKEKIHEKIEEHKHKVEHKKEDIKKKVGEKVDEIHEKLEHIKHELESEKANLHQKIEHKKEEIKEKVEEKLHEIKDKLQHIKHKVEAEKEKIHEKIEEHKHKVEHQKEEFKEKVDEKFNEIKDKLQHIKHKVEAEKEKIHEKIEEHKHKVEHQNIVETEKEKFHDKEHKDKVEYEQKEIHKIEDTYENKIKDKEEPETENFHTVEQEKYRNSLKSLDNRNAIKKNFDRQKVWNQNDHIDMPNEILVLNENQKVEPSESNLENDAFLDREGTSTEDQSLSQYADVQNLQHARIHPGLENEVVIAPKHEMSAKENPDINFLLELQAIIQSLQRYTTERLRNSNKGSAMKFPFEAKSKSNENSNLRQGNQYNQPKNDFPLIQAISNVNSEIENRNIKFGKNLNGVNYGLENFDNRNNVRHISFRNSKNIPSENREKVSSRTFNLNEETAEQIKARIFKVVENLQKKATEYLNREPQSETDVKSGILTPYSEKIIESVDSTLTKIKERIAKLTSDFGQAKVSLANHFTKSVADTTQVPFDGNSYVGENIENPHLEFSSSARSLDTTNDGNILKDNISKNLRIQYPLLDGFPVEFEDEMREALISSIQQKLENTEISAEKNNEQDNQNIGPKRITLLDLIDGFNNYSEDEQYINGYPFRGEITQGRSMANNNNQYFNEEISLKNLAKSAQAILNSNTSILMNDEETTHVIIKKPGVHTNQENNIETTTQIIATTTLVNNEISTMGTTSEVFQTIMEAAELATELNRTIKSFHKFDKENNEISKEIIRTTTVTQPNNINLENVHTNKIIANDFENLDLGQYKSEILVYSLVISLSLISLLLIFGAAYVIILKLKNHFGSLDVQIEGQQQITNILDTDIISVTTEKSNNLFKV